jgi:hypothetical protein
MRKTNRMKLVGLLLSGGMLLQLWGGCGSLLPQIGIGFARSLGAIPGAVVGDLIFDAIDLGGTTG